MTCDTCIHWRPYGRSSALNTTVGQCRRHAPQIDKRGRTQWPVTSDILSCGDHQAGDLQRGDVLLDELLAEVTEMHAKLAGFTETLPVTGLPPTHSIRLKLRNACDNLLGASHYIRDYQSTDRP